MLQRLSKVYKDNILHEECKVWASKSSIKDSGRLHTRGEGQRFLEPLE